MGLSVLVWLGLIAAAAISLLVVLWSIAEERRAAVAYKRRKTRTTEMPKYK